MKRHLIILSIFILTQIQLFGQETIEVNPKTFWDNTRAELSMNLGVLGELGFTIKGKKELFSNKHFESRGGLAFVYNYLSETDKLAKGVKGDINYIATYVVLDVAYYPFKNKGLFVSSEFFGGYANLSANGSLSIPKYNIYTKYSDSFSYFNYGIGPSIGYEFNKFGVSLFSSMSLRALLNSQRLSPIDQDATIFGGINFIYKL